MMLLAPLPWAHRVWALPFFTVLAPSERYHQQHRRRHKTLTDWGRQMIRQRRRWLPERQWVVGADSTSAVLELLACAAKLIEPVAIVTRWRLDMEVTFHEVRAHLGVETQRQWSSLSILRTTPALLALFSLVTIFTHQLLQGQSLPVRQAAWYSKALPTFSDTLDARASASVAGDTFLPVACQTRQGRNPSGSFRALHPNARMGALTIAAEPTAVGDPGIGPLDDPSAFGAHESLWAGSGPSRSLLLRVPRRRAGRSTDGSQSPGEPPDVLSPSVGMANLHTRSPPRSPGDEGSFRPKAGAALYLLLDLRDQRSAL
jgi:hypothetical protein